jgi:cob(I)alamin adenosyltransferase
LTEDEKKRGMVYVYSGTGAGKTTNALGIAMRCVGHEQKVVVIQFMKWWKKTGEYKIRKRLKPYYEIYQFGRKGWIGLDNLNERDRAMARKGLEFAKKVVAEKKPSVIILDEMNLALHCKLLDMKEVVQFLHGLPPYTDAVLTGRYAPKELIEAADFVNEVRDVKHPKKMVARAGIQY